MCHNAHTYGLSLLLAGAALLTAVTAPSLKADEIDKKIVFTFSAPVEIPGHRILPAGTYVFKLAPDSTNTIMIKNADESKPLGMFYTQPVFSLDISGAATIQLEERNSGAPQAIKSWTYPGDPYGFVFIYPDK